ncbi:MAG TPA: ABC transporter substrate-binding protein, partial [Pseudonocardiaceae bacterium]|nr:ABC transporter substrate-binding protein [Pseudonocardiaceae bacterium]
NTPMMVSSVYPQRSSDFWRLSGTTGVGTIWPATRYRPSWNGITKIGRWFVDGYMKRYGSFPPDTALTHFTDVTIIAAAVDAARSDSREDVLDALEAMQFDTWRGPVSFERGPAHWHHTAPELILLQYQHFEQNFDDSAIIYPRHLASAEYQPPSAR